MEDFSEGLKINIYSTVTKLSLKNKGSAFLVMIYIKHKYKKKKNICKKIL